MMMKNLWIVLLFVIGCYSYPYCEAPDPVPSVNTHGLQLEQVIVHFRHGDRTPVHIFPFSSDEAWDCTLNHLTLPSMSHEDVEQIQRLFRKTYLPGRQVLKGNCNFGQLTSKGLEQHLRLGDSFRSLYVDQYGLLDPELNVSQIWVRSSDVPRTLDSTMAQLTGLFPPSANGDFDVDLININTMDTETENMWANFLFCPRLIEIEQSVFNSSEWIAEQAKILPFQQKLQSILNISSISDWSSLLDVMESTRCHGFPLPNGITDDIADQINEIASWQAAYLWDNDEYGKLGSGLFLKEIFDRMDDRVNNNIATPNYFMYGGHDTTVGPLAATLGIFDGVWPPYRSHIEFELWSDAASNFYVQLKYNGQVKSIPSCSVMCPWDQFSAFVSSRLLNYPQECMP